MEENLQQTQSYDEKPVEQPTQEVQQQDTSTKPFEIPTEVQELVGEGKKYRSPEDALKSVPHAQQHIQTLETELATLREELNNRRTTQELLDELKSGMNHEQQTAPQDMQQDNVMALVQQAIQQNEVSKTSKANADNVAKQFQTVYGSEAEKVYNKLAADSGLTVAQLNTLATTSPSVVIKLAGLDSKTTNVTKSSSDVNTEAYNSQTAPAEVSARVSGKGSTKDLVRAWQAAGEKVKRQLA